MTSMGDVWLATQIPPFLGLFSLEKVDRKTVNLCIMKALHGWKKWHNAECSIEYQNALLVHNMTMKKAMPSQVKRNCSWTFRYALVHCLAQSFKKKQINPFVDMLRFEPWGMQDRNILRPRSKDRVAILNREREQDVLCHLGIFSLRVERNTCYNRLQLNGRNSESHKKS